MQRNNIGSRLMVKWFYLDKKNTTPTACSTVATKTTNQKYHFLFL